MGKGFPRTRAPPSQPQLTLSTSKYHGAELGLQSKIWGHKCSATTAGIQAQKSRCGFPPCWGWAHLALWQGRNREGPVPAL